MNTALQALASTPATSNLILSVDSETLTNVEHKALLLKLQTILYALRSNVLLPSSYLREFRDSISIVSGRKWNDGNQHDASDFFITLCVIIDSRLLPAGKRDSFRSLLYFTETVISEPLSERDGIPVLASPLIVNSLIEGVDSVQKGLAKYFGKIPVNTSNGARIRQKYIHTPPQVLDILVSRHQVGSSTKITRDIEIPTKINIDAYRLPDAKWDLSPEYELRYVAVHSGSTVNSGHYYGYKYDNSSWIQLNDSSVSTSHENVPVITSGGTRTAYMLHYVNVGKKADLLKVEPVPPKIMTQIDGELARQMTLETNSTSSYYSNTSFNSSTSNTSTSNTSTSNTSTSNTSTSNTSTSNSSTSNSSGSGSGSGSGSNSGFSPSTNPTTLQNPVPSSPGAPNAPAAASIPKKFSWFGLGNDAINLKPELISFSLAMAAIALMINWAT